MSAQARRPLNWNVLGVDARSADRTEHQLLPSARAREIGGRVVALTMPVFSDNNMSFLTFCALWLLPGWRDVLNVDVPERIRRLKDAPVRADMMDKAKESNLAVVAHFDRYLIGEVYSPDNEAVRGRMVGDIAEERGVDPFTCLVDIVANDDLRTVLWPQPATNGPDDWRARAELWQHRDVMLGGSDAGAHLDRMLGSPYPTRFLGDTLRGRQLVPLERAVQLITDVPAGLFGLRDRGRLASGNFADIVVFDPERIDAGSPETVFDLPGQSKRLLASSIGVEHVFVNGIETSAGGAATGNISGTVLRSGRDTYTVDTASS